MQYLKPKFTVPQDPKAISTYRKNWERIFKKRKQRSAGHAIAVWHQSHKLV